MNPWQVVLRCDASPSIGFGHLFRSLALAREFSERGVDVSFAVAEGPEAIALIERERFAVFRIPARVPGSAAGGAAFPRSGVDAVVLDVRDDSPRRAIETLRARGVLVATIDDPTDRRLSADLAFYPPIPQVEEFDWTGFSGTRVAGGEWVVLRRAFAVPPLRAVRERPTILITMGGSDPAGMTLTALDSVVSLADAFDVTVVLGPGYRDRDRLASRLASLRRTVRLVEQPADMHREMLDADVAIASFGVTAYELAATATPAIYLCLTPDHQRSATWLLEQGAGMVVGVHTGHEGPALAAAAAALAGDRERRLAMGRAGRAFIDGGGAARVAERIIAELVARAH